MISSRDLNNLHPAVKKRAEAFLAAAKAEGIDLLVTSTYRDAESQQALYDQGRIKPGRKVTNAKPGQSWHNWRCALDAVPLRAGKPVWGTSGEDGKLWARVGAIGEACGLEWAARWKGSMREFAHFQWSAGLSIADLQAGKKIPIDEQA